jgi:hypothetical protein
MHSFAGDSHKAMKKRTILCVDQNEIALPEEQCEEDQKPHDYEQCSLILPPCSIDDNNDLINDDDNNHNIFSDNEIPDVN